MHYMLQPNNQDAAQNGTLLTNTQGFTVDNRSSADRPHTLKTFYFHLQTYNSAAYKHNISINSTQIKVDVVPEVIRSMSLNVAAVNL